MAFFHVIISDIMSIRQGGAFDKLSGWVKKRRRRALTAIEPRYHVGMTQQGSCPADSVSGGMLSVGHKSRKEKNTVKQAVIDGVIGTDDIEALAEVFSGFVVFNPDTGVIIDAKATRELAYSVMRRCNQNVDLAVIKDGKIRLASWIL